MVMSDNRFSPHRAMLVDGFSKLRHGSRHPPRHQSIISTQKRRLGMSLVPADTISRACSFIRLFGARRCSAQGACRSRTRFSSSFPISDPRVGGERIGSDRRTNFHLCVTLDIGLCRTAALFTPNQRNLGAWFAMLHINHRQRQYQPFVGGVTSEGGNADRLTVLDDLVVGQGGINRGWPFDKFAG